MCCNLRTHVTVISILSLVILTGLNALNLMPIIIAIIKAGNAGLALTIQVAVFTVSIVAAVLCRVGVIKNNKCRLIPFMIYLCAIGLMCIGFGIFVIYSAAISTYSREWGNLGRNLFLLMLIPMFVGLALAIYFFVIVVKFYNELSSGIRSGNREGMVLQRYASPQGVPTAGGGSTVYAPYGAQNVSYAYQQLPATNIYPQQGYGYPAQNPGLKGQV